MPDRLYRAHGNLTGIFRHFLFTGLNVVILINDVYIAYVNRAAALARRVAYKYAGPSPPAIGARRRALFESVVRIVAHLRDIRSVMGSPPPNRMYSGESVQPQHANV
jgi:hypothetical protein